MGFKKFYRQKQVMDFVSWKGGLNMGFQCVPQTIGLVRGEPKAGQKNRANGAGICAELGEERYSNSTTIDHE